MKNVKIIYPRSLQNRWFRKNECASLKEKQGRTS
jgi:hypothetical protein